LTRIDVTGSIAASMAVDIPGADAPGGPAPPRRVPGIFSTETIERFIAESSEALSEAGVHDFTHLFMRRFARERLRALSQARGTLHKDVPEVLFVCVHNAGRSQMAAGLLDRHAEGRVHVRSAGSTPADEVNPAVVEAMNGSASTSPGSSPSH
jgi:arsenate reductase